MAYATVADVTAYVPKTLWEPSTTSHPTIAETEVWLDAASRFVDGSLRWKYGVPVTDAGGLVVVKQAVAKLVAAQVWDAVASHGVQELSNATSLRRGAYSELAYNPKSGQSSVMLPGTALSDTGEAALGQPASSFSDPDSEGSNARLFSIGMGW